MISDFAKGVSDWLDKGKETEMFGLSERELLFYGGIAVMSAAGILTVGCCILFTYTGRRLKKKLEQEYGKRRDGR